MVRQLSALLVGEVGPGEGFRRRAELNGTEFFFTNGPWCISPGGQWMWRRQSRGTRPEGPGTGWSAG
jgi:hypothetical protein